MSLKSRVVPVLIRAAFLLVLAVPAASSAKTGTAAQPLSLNQAITMAQSNNVNLLTAQINVQMANNTVKSATSNFSSSGSFTPSGKNGSGGGGAATGLVNAGYAQQNDYAALGYQQNNVIYATESAYLTVQDAVYAEQVKEKSVDEAREAYNIAEISFQQGVDTATDVSSAQYGLESAKAALAAAKANEDAAYVSFDNTVGLDPGERPDLTDVAYYDPNYVAGVVSADQAVAQTLSNNYQAIQAQNNVLAEQETAPISTNPSTNSSYAIEEAQLAQNATTQTLTADARTGYLELGSAQDAYDAAQKAMIAEQASYSDAQANYNVGVYTKYQLLQAQVTLLSDGQTLQQDLHQLLLARANLALLTGVGSVTIPVKGQ
jgi:outer membrane protein TolC